MADVTLYTRQFCGFCTAAKRLLDGKGVGYTEHDATFSPDLKQEMIAKANVARRFRKSSLTAFMSEVATSCTRSSVPASSIRCWQEPEP